MEWLQKIIELDQELFLYLNGFNSSFWDTIMLMITRKETWIPIYLIILFYIIKNYRSKSLLIIIFFALTIIASDQISVLLKETIQRLRPVHEPSIQHLVHNVLKKGGLHGFVSSHASNSFAIFVFTSRIFKNRSYRYLFFIWALVIAYSRIYCGVHYPLDIMGGAMLGCLLAIIFYRLLMFVENHFFIARAPKIEKTFLEKYQSQIIYLSMGILICAMFIFAGVHHYYNLL